MKKKKSDERKLSVLISLVVWISGVLVALAVGFGMVDGILSIRFLSPIITSVAGWIVVALTLLGALLRIIDWMK